jgi:hypothetical protein
MTEAWISLPSAVERVRAHGGLSTGAANVRAIEAFSSGLVQTRWAAFQGIRGGEAGTQPPIARHAWEGAGIPETDLMVSADGTRRRGITVNEADLTTWLSRARQGTSDAAAETEDLRTAFVVPATEAPFVVAKSGVRMKMQADAEKACVDFIKGLPKDPRIRKEDLEEKAHEMFQGLSGRAFGRQWDLHIHSEWKAQGAPQKSSKQ